MMNKMAGLFNDDLLTCPTCNNALLEEKIIYALDIIKNKSDDKDIKYVPVEPKKVIICTNCKKELATFSMPVDINYILKEENKINE